MDVDFFAGPGRVSGFDDLAIDADVTLFDKSLEGAAGNGGKLFAQECVESLGRQRFFNRQMFGARAHGNASSVFFGVCSFFQVMRKIKPTPVQIAVSAMLKAGKPGSPPLPPRSWM